MIAPEGSKSPERCGLHTRLPGSPEKVAIVFIEDGTVVDALAPRLSPL